MKPLRHALATYAGIAGTIRLLATPGKLSDDEFKVVAMGVLAMAFGEAAQQARR